MFFKFPKKSRHLNNHKLTIYIKQYFDYTYKD